MAVSRLLGDPAPPAAAKPPGEQVHLQDRPAAQEQCWQDSHAPWQPACHARPPSPRPPLGRGGMLPGSSTARLCRGASHVLLQLAGLLLRRRARCPHARVRNTSEREAQVLGASWPLHSHGEPGLEEEGRAHGNQGAGEIGIAGSWHCGPGQNVTPPWARRPQARKRRHLACLCPARAFRCLLCLS